MRTLHVLFKTELKLTLREFSGVLFGIIMPVGIMLLLGTLYGGKPASQAADYSLLQQSMPAVMSIGIAATGLMGIPLSIASYREKKVLKRFKVTPVSPFSLLAAQFLNNLVFTLFSAFLVASTAVIFFGYTLRGNLLSFAGAYLLVLTAIYSVGVLIAGVSGNLKSANLLCSIAYFPMLFLSGATIPFEIFPAGLQKVSSFMPLSQGIILLKGISLGLPDYSPFRQVLVLTITSAICLVIGIRKFRWE